MNHADTHHFAVFFHIDIELRPPVHVVFPYYGTTGEKHALRPAFLSVDAVVVGVAPASEAVAHFHLAGRNVVFLHTKHIGLLLVEKFQQQYGSRIGTHQGVVVHPCKGMGVEGHQPQCAFACLGVAGAAQLEKQRQE